MMNNDNEIAATKQNHAVAAPLRLRCGPIVQKIRDDQLEVSVSLEYDGEEFTGYAAGRNTDDARLTFVAIATLSAVHAFLGIESNPFRLMSVKRISSTPVPICMVLMEFVCDAASTVLVGAAEIAGNEAISAQRATMDAINRKVSGLHTERSE